MVPGLKRPPTPTYTPSVFSRNTTKLMSRRVRFFSGLEAIVEQAHRAVVHVEVELEPRAEQDVAGVPVIRHARIAQRADQDGVEGTEVS